MGTFRYLLCLVGIILAIPVLGLITLAIKLPITISGIIYLLACSLIVSGLVTSPLLPRHYYLLIIAGVSALIIVVSARVVLVGQSKSSEIKMITLPSGETRWISYIIDEQDSLIFGEALFHLIGGDSQDEHENLTPAFLMAYSEMKKQGEFPSPIASTYLNLQQPNHFDAVIIEPESKEQLQFGVVFLHGYMGNVNAQCWEIAQAVKKLNGMTICPSTGWRGEWWRPEGQAILQSTFDYLRTQSIQKLYLGGFSNGGFGISRLASQLGNEKRLSGLIFIDGFANGVSIKEVGLPVLIIEGKDDERVPVSVASQFAMEVGDLGTYRELSGDHFLIMKHPDLVQNEIVKWLEEQESGK